MPVTTTGPPLTLFLVIADAGPATTLWAADPFEARRLAVIELGTTEVDVRVCRVAASEVVQPPLPFA